MIEDPPPEQVVRPTSKCEGCGKEFPSRNAGEIGATEHDKSKDANHEFVNKKSLSTPNKNQSLLYIPPPRPLHQHCLFLRKFLSI